MDKQIIVNCERAHYLMQLSSYFSELTDLPGVSYSYTNLVTDTWYNQAYNIRELSSEHLAISCEDILSVSKQYFADRKRETCFYLTPDSSDFERFLEDHGFISFDEEAWMFFDFDRVDELFSKGNSDISIKEVNESSLDDFKEVYYRTLPGPEVKEYVQCVINGFISCPSFVEIKYYLAYVGDVAVGMLSLLSMGKYSGLYAVAVEKQHQNKGICRALATEAVKQCRTNGTEYLFLQTGNGEESQKVFERLGFSTQFVRKGYVSKAVADEMQHG